MNVTPDPLVTSAARFRIDIFPPTVRCENNQAPRGAQPRKSYTFEQGEAFKIDDAPTGPQIVVITAYADMTSTIGNAGACIEMNLAAGEKTCVSIKLQKLCSDDKDNCGSCGNVCSSIHVSDRACTGGVCSGICENRFFDCNKDKLGDGCECEQVDTTQPACCGTGCQIRHFTGLGVSEGGASQTWVDCTPPDTYSVAQAVRACRAFVGTDPDYSCEPLGCAPPLMIAEVVCALPSTRTVPTDLCGDKKPTKLYPCWSVSAHRDPGLVRSAPCGTCPNAGDPPWH